MEEKKYYSIKEISGLLDIPKATIRYWDKEGVIAPPRNPQNSYREFSMAEAMELSNISFYRSIDIPMKELKQMLRSDISVQEELLSTAAKRLERKQLQLQQQAERIRLQQQALKEIRRLKGAGLHRARPIFEWVTSFSRGKESHWERIIARPGTFALFFSEETEGGFQYGIGYEEWERPKEEERLLWERPKEEKPLFGETAGSFFLEGLLTADSRDESKNDLGWFKRQLQRQGIQTGRVIAQYLTSGVKGGEDIWDYYRMWIEVKNLADCCPESF